MEIVFILVIGLCIGSFLNVCIYRLPKGESISFPPSHCQNCGYRLKVKDLIPVFSYIFLRNILYNEIIFYYNIKSPAIFEII